MKIDRPLVLASSSPRRKFLMSEAGFTFSVEKPDVDETWPKEIPVDQVAKYLAAKKAEYFRLRIHDEIIVTADTVVILSDEILNKPADRDEAIEMLTKLSGRTHIVMTGVCIVSKEKEETFDDTTEVTFQSLSREEIEFYVDNFKPYDKAGAYGAQECLPAGLNPCSKEEMQFLKSINNLELMQNTISKTNVGKGMVAIRQIDGSYFNVMGLPIHKVYAHLRTW